MLSLKNHKQIWVLPATLLVVASTLAMAQGTAPIVGAASHVIGAVTAIHPGGETQTVTLNDKIVQDETLETRADAGVHMLFLDDTVLRMGENSKLTIDTFVYDPATREGINALEFNIGAFRFITGKMAKEEISIKLPTGILGVRGTDLEHPGIQQLPDLRDRGAAVPVVAAIAGRVHVPRPRQPGQFFRPFVL